MRGCSFFDDERYELEGAAIDEAAVGEAQVWQAGEGDEGHGHKWRWHAAADGFPGFFEGGDVCCHFFGGFVVHEAGDRELGEAEHFSVGDCDHAAAAIDEGVGGEGHVVVVCADDEQIVGVVSNGGCHGAAFDAEAFDEADAFGAGGMVAFEDDGFEHVLLGVAFEMAARDGELDEALDVADARRNDFDGADGDAVAVFRRSDLEGVGGDGIFQMDALARPVWVGVWSERVGHFSVDGDGFAVDDGANDVEMFEILQQDDVGAFPRSDGAEILIHAVALGGVDGGHADGGDWIDAVFDGDAQDVIHVAVADEGVWMGVVADEAGEATADAGFGEGFGDHWQILPGAAHAQLGVHAETHFGDDVFGTGGFVAAADAAGGVGVQSGTGFWQGVVAGDDFVCDEGGVDDAVGVVIAGEDAWEVHHFAEAHDLVSLHGAGDVFWSDETAGVFKSWHGWHAGRGDEHAFERCALCVVDHAAHAVETEHVADLVGIGIDADGAVGHDGFGVFADGEHGGFDVDVTVEKTWRHVEAAGVDDLGVWADAGCGVADEGDASFGDGDVDVFLELGGADVDERAAADDGVSGLAALGDGGEGLGDFPERVFAKMIVHGEIPF